MMIQEAQEIMARNVIGPEELQKVPQPFLFSPFEAPEIPFSRESLRTHAPTHLLIFTPLNKHITINWFKEKFGTDPSREPCMYNQDWYLKEDFADKTSLDGKWHLIQKNVRENMRALEPEKIEGMLDHEQLPSAITCTFTFFAWRLLHGETLWKHDFVWCHDRDHNGDRIYVGRYEDPEGVNKKGFNIHRHLTLRSAYSAAPEIVT